MRSEDCFGVRRLDAAFRRPGLTGRKPTIGASSRPEEKRRQAAPLQIKVLVFFLALAGAGSAMAADLPLLVELQKSLAGATNVQSDFVQEKNLALLQRVVVIKGRLAVQQPDHLSWQVLEPIRYNLVIDGTTLKQWDEETGKVQSMSLAGNPVFKVVVTQLRAWFSGQFDLLIKDFTVEADGASAAPRLVFTPRHESFAFKVIGRVVLTFRDDKRYIQEMVIEERSGDRTRMLFTNTVLNAAVDPLTWEVKPQERGTK